MVASGGRPRNTKDQIIQHIGKFIRRKQHASPEGGAGKDDDRESEEIL